MGNGTAAVAIIALLIGVGGLGLVAYNTLQPATLSPLEAMYLLEKIIPPPSSGVKNTWFKFNNTLIYGDITKYINHTGLTIEFEVESEETVYLCYNGMCILPLGGYRYAAVYFRIDGVKNLSPYSHIEMETGSFTEQIPIVLQYAISLSPGNHNVTIMVSVNNNNIGFYGNTLLVQTYIA